MLSSYRYLLKRPKNGSGMHYINFIMLNPSTADDTIDDATIRRCKSIVDYNKYNGFYVTNLFSLPATKPKDLRIALKKTW